MLRSPHFKKSFFMAISLSAMAICCTPGAGSSHSTTSSSPSGTNPDNPKPIIPPPTPVYGNGVPGWPKYLAMGAYPMLCSTTTYPCTVEKTTYKNYLNADGFQWNKDSQSARPTSTHKCRGLQGACA